MAKASREDKEAQAVGWIADGPAGGYAYFREGQLYYDTIAAHINGTKPEQRLTAHEAALSHVQFYGPETKVLRVVE